MDDTLEHLQASQLLIRTLIANLKQTQAEAERALQSTDPWERALAAMRLQWVMQTLDDYERD